MSAWEGSQMQMDREDREAEAKRRCRACNAPSHLHNLQIPSHDALCPNRPREERPRGTIGAREVSHRVVMSHDDLRAAAGAPDGAVVEATAEGVVITWKA